MSRYVLMPRFVTSATDGDRHYISGPQLARLYGVNYHECLFITHNQNKYLPKEGDIILIPRYNGDYQLPRTNHER